VEGSKNFKDFGGGNKYREEIKGHGLKDEFNESDFSRESERAESPTR
jgi:hypothetical protein